MNDLPREVSDLEGPLVLPFPVEVLGLAVDDDEGVADCHFLKRFLKKNILRKNFFFIEVQLLKAKNDSKVRANHVIDFKQPNLRINYFI